MFGRPLQGIRCPGGRDAGSGHTCGHSDAVRDDHEDVERGEKQEKRAHGVLLRSSSREEVANRIILGVEEERCKVVVLIGPRAAKADKIT